MRYFAKLLLAVLALFSVGQSALAEIDSVARQHLSEIRTASGRTIQQIVFTDPSTPESLRQKFLTLNKKTFQAAEVRRIIQWFHETQGDSRLDVSFEVLSARTLRLIVTFKPRKKVTSIKLMGNRALTENIILPILDIREGADMDVGLMESSAKKLANYYFRQGYLQAEVTYKI